MPTVNINGNAGGPGGPNGPSGGNGSGPRRGSFFSTSNPDYGRAEAQRRAREDSENRAYEQRDSQDAAARAGLNRQTAADIRAYEAQKKADERARQNADRRRQQDERLQAQLERRSQMEAMQRGQQEWALRRAYSHMQHTASGHLSPTGLRNMGHRADIFSERLGAFRNRWGAEPYYGGNINALRGGLGDTHGAYQVQEILRMGRFGQRAAFDGNYRELVRIEREIRHLERTADKQFKFDSSPAAQANLDRQKRALEGARASIAAGTAGHGPIYNKIARGYGSIMNTWRDPVMRTVMDAVMTTVAAPYVGNRLVSGVVGMERPYLNWDLAAHAVARGSGGRFDALSMQRQLLNMSKSGFTPGNGLTGFSSEFGLSPSKVFDQALSYGVPLRHSWGAARLAATVRMASLGGGMQLPEEQLLKGLSGAVSIGAVGNGQAGWNKYFQQLQKTMAVATKQGVNESQMAGAFNSIMQSAANHGGTFSFDGMSQFFRSLVGTSAAGRTGALQSSILQGVQQSGASLGGDNSATLLVGSYMQAHPEAFKNGQSLAKALGIKYSDLTATPQGQRAIADVLSAYKAHNPWATQKYLGSLIQNYPDAWKRIYQNSPMAKNLGPLSDIILGTYANTSISSAQAWQTATPGAGNAAMAGMLPIASPDLQQLMDAKTSGTMTKAMQTALIMTESRGNPAAISKKGALGLTQIMPNGALAAYNQAHGTNYTAGQAYMNQSLNLDVGDWYYKEMLKLAGGDPVVAYGLYNWGPGKNNSHVGQIRAGLMPAETRKAMRTFSSYYSQAGGQQESLADYRNIGVGDASSLEGSRYVTYGADKIIAAFSTAAASVESLAGAAGRAAAALDKLGHTQTGNYTGGYISPSGYYVPNDTSSKVVK